MREANVYILSNLSWVKAFPKIMEVAVSKGAKVHVRCDSEAIVQEIDNLLWTYEQLSFLPHATDKDPMPNEQPIIISSQNKPLNSADVLALVGKDIPENIQDYKKALILCDPKDASAKEATYKQIDFLKKNDFKIRYFKQNQNGAWEAANSF